MARQDEYPLHAVTEETVILGYESSDPKLTRNYSASEVGGFTIWGEIQDDIQNQTDLIALIDSISGENISNANLTFDGNHLVDMAGYSWALFGINTVVMEAGNTASTGAGNFNFISYGTSASDIGFLIGNNVEDFTYWYNDGSIEHFGDVYTVGNIGVGTSPVSNRKVYASATGTDIGIYMQSVSGAAGYFNSTGASKALEVYNTALTGSSVAIDATSNDNVGVFGHGGNFGVAGEGITGVYGYSTGGGWGVLAAQSSGLGAFKSTGKVNFTSLPTSSAGLSTGDVWNDSGTLKIV